MTLDQARAIYPALMAYIEDRNALLKPADWCAKLREDEGAARRGEFAGVAAQLEQAQADRAAEAKARGHDPYPYNSAMGEFLGLPIKANHEPEHGYYMASCLAANYRLGVAEREAARLISEGAALCVVTARSKATRKPIRFVTFKGDQIKIGHGTVEASNGKRRVRLSSNWSVETCMERLVVALRTGAAYGEASPT